MLNKLKTFKYTFPHVYKNLCYICHNILTADDIIFCIVNLMITSDENPFKILRNNPLIVNKNRSKFKGISNKNPIEFKDFSLERIDKNKLVILEY